MHFISLVMHALYIAMCNIGSDLADWPAFQSQPGLCSPHLGPSAGVWLSPAIATPCDWWQLFTDEAVFIIPVQGCTDQMDPDHPSTVRDTSVPVVAQSTNKSPAPWKAAVSRRGMDAAACCLLKTRERSLTHKTTKSLFHSWVFAQYDDWCLGVYFLWVSFMKFCALRHDAGLVLTSTWTAFWLYLACCDNSSLMFYSLPLKQVRLLCICILDIVHIVSTLYNTHFFL